MPQQGQLSLGGRPPPRDETAVDRRPEVQSPVYGKRPPRGRPFDPHHGPAMIDRHRAVRLNLQGWQALVMEPLPHLHLPASMITLNRCLKPRFPRWGEHRHHLPAQAQADHPPQGLGMLMGALKTGLVIKWRVGRQAPRPPGLQQGFGDHRRGRAGPWPRADQAPRQRDDLADFDLWATGDDEALDAVDAIDLSPGSGHLGQLPGERWGPAADPLSGIQGALSRHHAADRAQRRHHREPPLAQFAPNRGGSILPQRWAL
jgi:hypothetical protein